MEVTPRNLDLDENCLTENEQSDVSSICADENKVEEIIHSNIL